MQPRVPEKREIPSKTGGLALHGKQNNALINAIICQSGVENGNHQKLVSSSVCLRDDPVHLVDLALAAHKSNLPGAAWRCVWEQRGIAFDLWQCLHVGISTEAMMRQFERDDVLLAAAGDPNAQMRVERRREILRFTAEQRKYALEWATPDWVDTKAIKAIYAECKRITMETGVKHEVDHIIPIQGKKVCGLHVPWNLRVITKAANARKHCRFGDDDVVGFLSDSGYELSYGVNKLKRGIRIGKRVDALLVGPGCQTLMSIEYAQGEFVIDFGPELIDGEPFPDVAVRRSR